MSDAPAPVVAFLGPEATYTHQAALTAFPAEKYNLQSQTTIQDVFELVQKEKARYGVVPFENSSNGSVIFTLDLFVNAQNLHPDILVDGEVYLPIHHCLLSRVTPQDEKDVDDDDQSSKLSKPFPKLQGTLSPESGACTPTQATPVPQRPRVKPNKSISHIRKLYSHPQAWGQCKLFLNTYLKGVEQQDVSSTSKAAELVAQDESGTSAAISSKIAGEMNNLEMLAEGIEDREGNTTRFLIIRNTQDVPLSSIGVPSAAVPAPSSASAEDDEESGPKYKTMVSFTVAHGEAGALADCLAVFKRFNLNLTSINSRPSTESAWHYVFFIEFQGRKLAGAGRVSKALEELGWIAKEWRWLGSWENKLV